MKSSMVGSLLIKYRKLQPRDLGQVDITSGNYSIKFYMLFFVNIAIFEKLYLKVVKVRKR